MEKQARRKHDAEFKMQAVQLSMEEGKAVVCVTEGLMDTQRPHISMRKTS